MSLPEQIQKQVDEAQRIVEQHYGTGESETPETEAEQSEAAPEPATTAEPAPAPQARSDDATYEQRWRTQQGIVSALNGKLAQADQRIQSLEQVISMMQQAPAPQVPQSQPQQQFITDQDRENFGDDTVDLALRAARQENEALRQDLRGMYGALENMQQQFYSLQQNVVPTVQRVAHNQQRSANQEFLVELTRQVPNWETVNGDRRFHDWLLTPDPMSGISRQIYLEEAHKSLDIARVAAVFNSFLNGSATGAPTQVQGRRTAPSSDLQSQIAPGRSLSSAAPSANEARKWTRAEITKLYDDKLRGRYAGREAEFAALERDVFSAQLEGRVAA